MHGHSHGGGRGAPIEPPLAVPTEEFDFEAALKKFDKNELKGAEDASEAAGVVESNAAKISYKKDDFFDEISCEALEKLNVSEGDGAAGDARGRAAARRRTDIETFGGAARAQRGRGRGPGQGRAPGGRGRGQGRGQGRGRVGGDAVAA